MFDPLGDLQLVSDQGVSEQGDLTQGEDVGRQPVGEHRLRVCLRRKGIHTQTKISFVDPP